LNHAESALRRGVDILVGTPGRILDHIERGNLKMNNIQFVILDEADEMLNVGFKDDIERLLNAIPKYTLSLHFSSSSSLGSVRHFLSYSLSYYVLSKRIFFSVVCCEQRT
jgi:superfamily II DNA/RNA helicase